MCVWGGVHGSAWVDAVELLEPGLGWSDLPPLPSPRSHLAAAAL
jgi:hypothetical protein